MRLPSYQIPTASLPVALARAICDGSGLITMLTEDGPEHFACFGCQACAPAAAAATVARRPGAATAMAFADCPDDEAF